MRTIPLLLLAACASSHITSQPLPPLVVEKPAEAATGAARIIPGEHMIWEVAADGMTIGRAEMMTGDTAISSRFSTDGFASMFANVHEELDTPIGAPVHPYNLHTAIAWLRAWSPPPGAAPAKLDVTYDGDRYLVTCEPPIRDGVNGTPALRVACQFATRDPVTLTLDLADDSDRAPLRVVARIGSLHVVADLVSRELRGDHATPVPGTHASMP